MSETKKTTAPPSPGMRKLTYAFALLMIVLLAFIGLRLFAKTTEISVIGNSTYTEEYLLEKAKLIPGSQLEHGKRLYGVDEKKIEEGLLSSCPLLRSVKVVKNGFYGITIEVTEKEAVYYIENGTTRHTLSEDLCILTKVSIDPSSTPNLIKLLLPEYPELEIGDVLSLSNENTDYILRFLNEITKTSYFKDLTAIDFQKKYSIKATYQGTTELCYGTGENFAEKSRLIEQYLQKLTPSLYEKFDVSDPNSAFTVEKG